MSLVTIFRVSPVVLVRRECVVIRLGAFSLVDISFPFLVDIMSPCFFSPLCATGV